MKNQAFTTDELVDYLTRQVAPVHPLPGLWKATAAMFAIAFAVVVIAGLVLLPMRASMTELAFSPVYVINYVGLALVAVASACVLAFARVPGLPVRAPLLIALGLSLALLAALTLFGINAPVEPETRALKTIFLGWTCTRWVVLLQVPVFFMGWRFINRAAPVHPRLSALALSLFGVSIGALVLPMSCELQATQHLCLSHFVAPLVVVAVFALIFGRQLFRW